jgi:hypothetical protein
MKSAMRSRRVPTAVLALTLALISACVWTLGTGSADAKEYRYWSYWIADNGQWQYATVGPARVPANGSVDGWRFVRSAGDSASSNPPSVKPNFEQICSGSPSSPNLKQVGVVIDFGTPDDSSGEEPIPQLQSVCVEIEKSATGYAVANEVAAVQTDSSGLVCSIGGFPQDGCSAQRAENESAPTSAPPLLGILLLAALAGMTLFFKRRNRR